MALPALAALALPSLIQAGGQYFASQGQGGGPSGASYGPGGAASTKQQASLQELMGQLIQSRFAQPSPAPFSFQNVRSPFLQDTRNQMAGGVGSLFGLAGRAAGDEGFGLANYARQRALGGFGGLTAADRRTFGQGRELFREGLTQRGLNLGPAGAGLEGDFTNRFLQDIAAREFDREQAAMGLAGQLGGQAFGQAGQLGQAAQGAALGYGGFEQGQEAFNIQLQQIVDQINQARAMEPFNLANMFLQQRLGLVPEGQSVRLLGESPDSFFGSPQSRTLLPPQAPATPYPGRLTAPPGYDRTGRWIGPG